MILWASSEDSNYVITPHFFHVDNSYEQGKAAYMNIMA